MLLFTSSLATWEIILSWRLSALPGFIQSQSPTKDILALVFDTNYFQTELAGRHALNRETFEASPDAHNLHQLCSSEATYLRKKLSISTHVLGISFLREGVRSLFTEPVLQGTIPPPLLRDSVKRFLTSSLRSFHTEEIFTTPWKVGVEGAMRLMEMEMQSRYSWPSESFPTKMEERGFHRNKSDGLEGFYYRYFYVGHHSMRWRGSNGKDQSFRCNPKDHLFLTGMTVFDSGTPCIVMLRGLSSLPIHLTR